MEQKIEKIEKVERVEKTRKEMSWAERIEFMLTSVRAKEKRAQMSDMISDSLRFVSADNEKQEYTVEFKLEKWMENPRNELHGGVCCTFFDTTTGVASLAIAENRTVATVDLCTNFIARMPGSETLVIKTQVVKGGRRFIRLAAEAYSKESGKLIATCMSNYTVLDEPHPVGHY